ncbi:hypothetical protein [Campylobacter jejuni]|uniref:hypothetical protein n=1 Tax=Campylobacter jejuni TaxID=197 RepID=UPI0011A6CEF1|nr:hypothetical protein [Campylobacter jejuni]
MLLFVIICFLLIIFTLSYFIWWLIYRKAFKSKKKISKFLVFIGGIGLIVFYYTPYSYYLEPSFYKFKEICKLDPEIYQANGGKLDEEYYNKVLRYFDTDLDNISKIKTLRISDDKKHFSYWFEKWIGDRISFDFVIWFKNENATKDNIKKVSVYVWWRDLRPLPAGNEGAGFYLSGDRENCAYFKKEIK